MAIGKEEIFQVADDLKAKGENVTNNSVKTALKAEFGAGGNHNAVCSILAEWRKERGVESKNSKSNSTASVDKSPDSTKTPKKTAGGNGDSTINMLPEMLRVPFIALIKAISTLIGMVHSQERDAANVLVGYAKTELQVELDNERQHVVMLTEEIRLLTEENATLRASLSAKHEAVSAETLVAGLAKLAKNESLTSFIAAFCQQKEATQEVPAAGAAKKQKKPAIKKAA